MAPSTIVDIPRVKIIKDEEFLAYTRAVLAKAQKDVLLLTYKFELSGRPDARAFNSLVQVLYDLVGKKILSRILLNNTGRRSGLTRINENAARVLQKNGLRVRFLPDGRCQHAKALIVDNEFAIIGSHNWSPKSMTDNSEASVVIHDPGEVSEIKRHFQKIWEISKEL